MPAVKSLQRNDSESTLRTSTRKRKASQKAMEADVSARKRTSKTPKRPTEESDLKNSSNSRKADLQPSTGEESSVTKAAPLADGKALAVKASSSGANKRGRPRKKEAGQSVNAGSDLAGRERQVLKGPVGKALAVMREVCFLHKFVDICFLLQHHPLLFV